MRAAAVGMTLLCIVSGCTKTPLPAAPTASKLPPMTGPSTPMPESMRTPAQQPPVYKKMGPMTGPSAVTPAPAATPSPRPTTARPETNTIGIELIEIPAGEFTMGSPAGEEGRLSHEEQVAVTLTKPFWLGKTAVTQSQFKKVRGTTPWKGKENVRIDKDGAASWITWDEAKMFCDELTELEQEAGNLPAGESYRLPTEAEWEYACRAGTKTAYSFGDDESQLSDYAWFHGNTAREQYPHKVGMKKQNQWGLHDMHGNVVEWCSDWYGEKLPGGTDPVGSQRGPGRVTRGACWGNAPYDCRSANRFYRGSFDPDPYLGFRVARSQSAQ